MLKLNLSIIDEIGGNEEYCSRSLDPKSGARGLWSVSISMCLPIMKSSNFSQAHIVARTFFSIWVNRRSVSDIDCEVYATAFQIDFDFWSKTNPRPNADASSEIVVGTEWSYRASVVGFESSCFTFSSAVD